LSVINSKKKKIIIILNSFHSLCVLHLVSLDIQLDFKKDLQQLMFDLRLECFKVIMDHAYLGKNFFFE